MVKVFLYDWLTPSTADKNLVGLTQLHNIVLLQTTPSDATKASYLGPLSKYLPISES